MLPYYKFYVLQLYTVALSNACFIVVTYIVSIVMADKLNPRSFDTTPCGRQGLTLLRNIVDYGAV